MMGKKKKPRLEGQATIKTIMTGHALDKQRAYFRYRNQLRTQIRRRDYCQMHLNRSTILANTKDNKLEPDIFEKYSDLTNEVKGHLLKSVYKDITEVSHLPDETMKAQAQDDVITSYEDRLRKLGEEFQNAAAQVTEKDAKIKELEEKLADKTN
ncbi:hypothetical protein JTE90_007708 [Oedothorax gibbosus]|uniref:Uncharacterized protein n=1 Tax=Oedothorax gibbosus TaxID=931172 RepID=A0AAV6TLF2_9ARAC|nr:hypothetical protein JTE90_007708 [Oedothorax gibbosus]